MNSFIKQFHCGCFVFFLIKGFKTLSTNSTLSVESLGAFDPHDSEDAGNLKLTPDRERHLTFLNRSQVDSLLSIISTTPKFIDSDNSPH
jgi:hypothetical protein